MGLLDPDDDPARQIAKLTRITEVLMRRVEGAYVPAGQSYAQFERAAMLEVQVEERTRELARTLDLLHESNARLAAATAEAETARGDLTEAIESVKEGFALFDEDDRLVHFNSRFCADLPDVAERLAPGMAFRDYVRLVAGSTGLTLPDGARRDDWRRRRIRRHEDRHGQFDVEISGDRWLRVSEHRTHNGRTVVLQADVTQIVRRGRREQERMIDRQAQLTRAVLDHLAQGVCSFDRKARLVGWNARMEAILAPIPMARLAGLPLGALLGELGDAFAFATPGGRATIEAWAASPRRRPVRLEIERNGGRDGDGAIFAVAAQEMPDRGFVVSFEDVTDARRSARELVELAGTLETRVNDRTHALNAALEEARRAGSVRTRFLAAASHDLLQPLSAAKLFVAALQERVQPELVPFAGKALSALGSVESIIEALLDIARLESGRIDVERRTVSLGPILSRLAMEMAPLAAERGIALRCVPSSAQVVSDATWLRRILQNFVANAIRHTDGDTVLMGVRRDGASWRVEVIDRGPGIAEADRDAIFREFHQLGPHRSGAGGLGLGLAIAERASAMLGHRITLDSVLGRGSRFAVTLQGAAAGRSAEPDRPAEPSAPDIEALIVLLVENDEDLAGAIELMIEGWGAEVIRAADGEGARTLLEDVGLRPDAALIDYQLGPGMDGVDLHLALRERYGAIPTRIISADRGPALAARCLEVGVPLLSKPLSRAAVADFLAAASRQSLVGGVE
jgi:signal transduction histidine kinase/CheY-like chemotaxis protein